MNTKETQSFSKLFEELEQITQDFEDKENLDIDESLKKFERGLEISQTLKKRLSDVELKVKNIKDKFSNEE